MGRFFPHADFEEILKNMRRADNESYNSSFTYPSGGAIQYIHALLHDLPEERICMNEELLRVDIERKVATTNRREIHFNQLISSLPLPKLLRATNVDFDSDLYTYNKVLVFNLGFDAKGWAEDHWVYIPERDKRFYRVGFYDNIFGSDRMSLYVEIGLGSSDELDPEETLQGVLEDLRTAGIVTDQNLVSWHSVVLDPAYVHIHVKGQEDAAAKRAMLAERGVHSSGRYGAWKYCSIEDNIIEARDLAKRLV
jgi:protoporphyrinogen oxidase